jgi:hypothetical protein
MHTRFGLSGLAVAGLLTACMTAGTIAGAADAAPAGERWRVTTSMQMMGMQMPGQTMEICKEAGGDTPPIQMQKNCEMQNSKRSGNTLRFHMICTGKEAMEAEGESTILGPDHSRTVMHMKMAQGEMTMNSESQKLGPCTGAELNIQAKKLGEKIKVEAAQAQAQAQQSLAKMCADAAQKAESPNLLQMQCKDPETLRTYCANFQTHEPFRKQAEYEARMAKSGAPTSGATAAQFQPLTTSAKMCGVDAAQLRNRLCANAEAQGHMAFIATQCPVLAKAIAARECAGRSYTSVSERYSAICASFASPGDDGQAPAGEPSKPKSDALSKGKKILGGLLGN